MNRHLQYFFQRSYEDSSCGTWQDSYPYEIKESELLYSISDERLAKHSTILTSNRPPQDWYSIFPDPIIGQAILDRLLSGSIKIITTKGKSYRKERGCLINNKLTRKRNEVYIRIRGGES